MSIVAANLLPRERARLAPCPPRGASHIPPDMGANLAEASLHLPPLSGEPRGQGVDELSPPTHSATDPPTRAARPPPSAQRIPTSKRYPPLPLLSRRDLLRRATRANRNHSIRIRADNRLRQYMLTDHGPELRPASLPVFQRETAPPSPLPRSMPSLCWKKIHRAGYASTPPPRGGFIPFPALSSGIPITLIMVRHPPTGP